MTARAMRSGMTIVATVVLAGAAAPARAEIKPTKVEIKAFRDELVVLQDSEGGTYVVKPRKVDKDNGTRESPRVWYGPPTSKELWEQDVTGSPTDGTAWSVGSWAPRIPGIKPGIIYFKKDGSYAKSCDGKDDPPLTQLTGEKARAVLDKRPFMTPYTARRSHLLARDDSGVYYYVDRYQMKHGGKGFRVFVGRKGAMKQLPLVDVASDTAGEVFSTKSGDLRFTVTHTENRSLQKGTWVKGGRPTELVPLDVDANSVLIWSELGVYKFLGTLCDNI